MGGKRAVGRNRMSAIDTGAEEGGNLVLQGSDEGFGSNVSMGAGSGKMLLAGGSDLGSLVVGECTAP